LQAPILFIPIQKSRTIPYRYIIKLLLSEIQSENYFSLGASKAWLGSEAALTAFLLTAS
jgi:hypothetical protein